MPNCIGIPRSTNWKLFIFHKAIPRSRHLQFYDFFTPVEKKMLTLELFLSRFRKLNFETSDGRDRRGSSYYKINQPDFETVNKNSYTLSQKSFLSDVWLIRKISEIHLRSFDNSWKILKRLKSLQK